jgi:hypothetical protein
MKVMRRSAGFFCIVFGPLAVAFYRLAFVVVPVAKRPYRIAQFLFTFGPAMIVPGECCHGIGGHDLLLLLLLLLMLLSRLLLRVVVVIDSRIYPRRTVPLSTPSWRGRRASSNNLLLLLILNILGLVLLILSVHDAVL